MTTLEIYAKRDELAKRILSIDNETILDEISKILNKSVPTLPPVPSDEEIRERARRVSTAFRNGEFDKFIPLEELKKRHLS